MRQEENGRECAKRKAKTFFFFFFFCLDRSEEVSTPPSSDFCFSVSLSLGFTLSLSSAPRRLLGEARTANTDDGTRKSPRQSRQPLLRPRPLLLLLPPPSRPLAR